MVEYRPVTDDEYDAYREVLDYAFRIEAGPSPERNEDDEPDPIAERRGLFDDGDLVTTGAHLPLTVASRGRRLEVPGLSAVATRPEHRRRGLVRRLLRESLVEYREDGRPFSLLWPFKHAFYGRFGWGRLANLGRYDLEPSTLAPVVDHPHSGGRFAPLDEADIEALAAIDEALAARYDLSVLRSEAWFRHRFFEGWRTDPFVFGWYRDGDLGGYLRYQVTEDGDDRRLEAYEFGTPDRTATVNLLGYLYGHVDQVDRLRVFAPVDGLVFDLVDDPRDVELTVRPGPMGRLVDVVAGLEALPAPDGVGGTTTLAVADPLVDWNEGRFTVGAGDGTITVTPGDDDPDGSVSIAALSRLALGTTTAERARAAGALDADDDAVAFLDELFPPRETYLQVFF